MTGALEVFQGLCCSVLFMFQIGYQQCSINCRLVPCKYLSLHSITNNFSGKKDSALVIVGCECFNSGHEAMRMYAFEHEKEEIPHEVNAHVTCGSHLEA